MKTNRDHEGAHGNGVKHQARFTEGTDGNGKKLEFSTAQLQAAFTEEQLGALDTTIEIWLGKNKPAVTPETPAKAKTFRKSYGKQ